MHLRVNVIQGESFAAQGDFEAFGYNTLTKTQNFQIFMKFSIDSLT